MTKDEAREAIKQYLLDNEEALVYCVESLDSYNGFLDYDRYWAMDEFDDYFYGSKPSEIASLIHYGHDEEMGAGSEFNPNRPWFKFDGCGNLVSAFERDYTGLVDDYLVEDLVNHRRYIYWVDKDDALRELFDIYENGGECAEDNEDCAE